MKQWDVFTFDFPGGAHPAVIVSGADRVERLDYVDVLYCTSKRLNRPVKVNEVLLNSSDGLDWETGCRCDVTYLVEKSKLYQRRGTVCEERQRAIIRKFIACFRWTA